MDFTSKIPFYAKIALIFIGTGAFVFTMYIGREIILPLVFAALIAILLNPLVNYLIRIKIGKIFAISIVVAFATIVVIGNYLPYFLAGNSVQRNSPATKG